MHFTQEDYRKIEDWLYQRTVKDTELPSADPLDGTEMVPILQNNKNKTIGLNDFVKQVADMKLSDFYNVTANSKRPYLTLKEAISLVPVKKRKLGLTITYHNEYGNWLIYQFKGDSLNQWDSLNYWNNIIQQAIEEFVLYPDEEDITGVRDGNRTFLKFKNREYNPEEFSGMGMIILRKNLVGTAACSIDDEDHLNNILTQDMINQENTVYIVQYDFDLDGKVISIPKGCTLWFQGGSINNGTMYLQETAILGAFEFADMGTAKLFGKFNTGQIMTFSNDSYKAKEGGYFVPSTKPSSATPQEDAKQDRETFYTENTTAYTTETRQELRWWNGEEWILILDITDYKELKSIISDLVGKHNAEMAACYKYFKARCYALELRMDDAERRLDEHDVILENHETRITKVEGDIVSINNEINSIHNDIDNIEGDINTINNNITNIEGDINSIEQNITNVTDDISNIISNIADIQNIVENLDQTIENHIQQFIENNVIGVASVTVNGQKYVPDSNGNISLPDYPEAGGGTADKVAGKLKFTGASTAEYDGSSDVTVNIPEGGSGGGVADSVKGTLTIKSSKGTTLGTYNGSTDKTITLPSSGGGGGDTIITAKETLTIKQGNNTLGTYDGTEPKTITIPESSGGGGTADRVAKKLKFTGAVSAEYDGSEEVSVNIPSGGGGETGGSNQPLIFKGAVNETYDGSVQKEVTIPAPVTLADLDTKTLVVKNASGEEVVSYNAKEDKEIQLKKLHVKTNLNDTKGALPAGVSDTTYSGSLVPYDIDLLKGEGVVDLTKVNFGTSEHGIVLASGYIRRTSKDSTIWSFNLTYKHPFITTTVSSVGQACVKITVNSAENNSFLCIHTVVATYSDSTERGITNTDYGRNRSGVVGLRCGISGREIYIQGIRTANKNNDSIDFDPAAKGGKLLGFNILIIGHINR